MTIESIERLEGGRGTLAGPLFRTIGLQLDQHWRAVTARITIAELYAAILLVVDDHRCLGRVVAVRLDSNGDRSTAGVRPIGRERQARQPESRRFESQAAESLRR